MLTFPLLSRVAVGCAQSIRQLKFAGLGIEIAKPPANAFLEDTAAAALFRPTNAGTKCNKQPARIGTPIGKVNHAPVVVMLCAQANQLSIILLLLGRELPGAIHKTGRLVLKLTSAVVKTRV